MPASRSCLLHTHVIKFIKYRKEIPLEALNNVQVALIDLRSHHHLSARDNSYLSYVQREITERVDAHVAKCRAAEEKEKANGPVDNAD